MRLREMDAMRHHHNPLPAIARPRKLPNGHMARAIRGKAAAFVLRSSLTNNQRSNAARELVKLGTRKTNDVRVWQLPTAKRTVSEWIVALAHLPGIVEHSEGEIGRVGTGAGADTRTVKSAARRNALCAEVITYDALQAAALWLTGEALPVDYRQRLDFWRELARQHKLYLLRERTDELITLLETLGEYDLAAKLTDAPLVPKTLSAAKRPDREVNAYGLRGFDANPTNTVPLSGASSDDDSAPMANYRHETFKGGYQRMAHDPNRTLDNVDYERWLRLAVERPTFTSAWAYSQWLTS